MSAQVPFPNPNQSYHPVPSDPNQPQQIGDRGLLQDIQKSFTSEGNHQGTKIAGGLIGAVAVAGAGYLAYDQWLKHQNKGDSEEAKLAFTKLHKEQDEKGMLEDWKKKVGMGGDHKDEHKDKHKDGKKEKKHKDGDKKDKKHKDGKKEKKHGDKKHGDDSSSSSGSDSD